MARKKKIKEMDQFDVQMASSKPMGTQAQAVTKTIPAATQADALRQAVQGDPAAGKFDTMTVTKKPATLNPTVTPNKPGDKFGQVSSMMNIPEAIVYPYSIMLPVGMSSLFEGLKGLEPVTTRNGKVYVKLKSPQEMRGLIETFQKKNTPAHKMVLNGIKESVK